MVDPSCLILNPLFVAIHVDLSHLKDSSNQTCYFICIGSSFFALYSRFYSKYHFKRESYTLAKGIFRQNCYRKIEFVVRFVALFVSFLGNYYFNEHLSLFMKKARSMDHGQVLESEPRLNETISIKTFTVIYCFVQVTRP